MELACTELCGRISRMERAVPCRADRGLDAVPRPGSFCARMHLFENLRSCLFIMVCIQSCYSIGPDAASRRYVIVNGPRSSDSGNLSRC